MALFDESLVKETTQRVQAQQQKLAAALEAQQTQEKGHQHSAFERDLRLMIDIANGTYRRTDELVAEADQALARVRAVLLGNVLASAVSYPDAFWHTDLGIVVSRVRWWVSMDDLITISNAAALAYGENTQATRMRIARAIDSGTLEWVPDPSVSNSQQNRRVLLTEVERLRDLRSLPE